jgi:hypothetical protein
MATRDFFGEGIPMTLQLAIRASDGFVLASDLCARTTDTYGQPVYIPASYPQYESKLQILERHGIGIAIAGFTPSDINVQGDFCAALSEHDKLPADFAKWLEQWAEGYIKSHPLVKCSLLIVNPHADADRIVKLSVEPEFCRAVPDRRCMLHPDPTNPANFWPQYLRCHDRPTIATAIKIAAITLSMASDLSIGIGGLEVLQYRDTWKRLSEQEIEKLEDDCKDVKESIRLFLRRD